MSTTLSTPVTESKSSGLADILWTALVVVLMAIGVVVALVMMVFVPAMVEFNAFRADVYEQTLLWVVIVSVASLAIGYQLMKLGFVLYPNRTARRFVWPTLGLILLFVVSTWCAAFIPVCAAFAVTMGNPDWFGAGSLTAEHVLWYVAASGLAGIGAVTLVVEINAE